MKRIVHIAYLIIALVGFQLHAYGQLPLVCSGSRVRYGVSASPGATYQWQVMGGSIIQNYNDSVDIQWNTDGNPKSITATETFGTCAAQPTTDSVQVSTPVLNLGSGLETCDNKPLEFTPSIHFDTYKWSNGDTSRTITMTSQGWYTLTVTDSIGCKASDSIYLTLGVSPVIDLAKNDTLCDGTITLDAGSDGVTYNWSNGSSDRTVTVNAKNMPPVLTVTVVNAAGCSTTDTVYLYACNNSIKIPNAFTPGDVYNKTWQIPLLDDYPDASVDVFDRWGRRVFTCSHGYPSTGWDGTYNGKNLPMDAYFFVIKLNNGTKPISGSVTIIR